jgi:hypothetical protein
MWVKLSNDRCTLHGPRTPEEVAWLRGFLTFGDPQSDKDPHAKPQISLYNVFDNSFPAGLLALVRRELKASGAPYKLEVADTRERPCERVPLAEVVEHLAAHKCTLRPHQVEATEAAMKTSRGIIQLPTGTGKTTLAVAMILSLPTRWLFVVDSAHLVEDAAARYRELTGLRPRVRLRDLLGRLEDGQERLRLARGPQQGPPRDEVVRVVVARVRGDLVRRGDEVLVGPVLPRVSPRHGL